MAFWKPGTSKISGEALVGNKSDSKMTVDSHTKPKLSKGVLSMKFMKQKDGSEVTTGKDKKITDNFESKRGKLVCISEYFDFTAEFPGRRSFNGCNKAVERYYEQRLEDLNIRKRTEPTKSETITDEEMLNRYETLVGLPRGPNQGKRQEGRKSNQGSEEQKKRSLATSKGNSQDSDWKSGGNESNKKKKRFR